MIVRAATSTSHSGGDFVGQRIDSGLRECGDSRIKALPELSGSRTAAVKPETQSDYNWLRRGAKANRRGAVALIYGFMRERRMSPSHM